MVCNKCGAQLPNDAVFCNNCGVNLAQQSQMQQQPQIQQQPQMQQQPHTQQQPQMHQQPQMQYQYQQPVKQPVIQPKAKLGIAIGLVAAGIFFMGMLSSLALVVFAGYVVLKEEDNWLKKCAVRAVGTAVMFAVFYGLVSVGFDFIRIIETFADWNRNVDGIDKVMRFESVFLNIINGLETVMFFIMGIKALAMKSVKVPIVDGLISRYMN